MHPMAWSPQDTLGCSSDAVLVPQSSCNRQVGEPDWLPRVHLSPAFASLVLRLQAPAAMPGLGWGQEWAETGSDYIALAGLELSM